MALMTGKMAGLEPSEKVIRSVGDYLESVSHEYGARYSYLRQDPATLTMTAEGLLCRQYLGWPSSHPALQRAIEVDLLPTLRCGRTDGERLLLVLRYASAASCWRQSLGDLERSHEGGAAQSPRKERQTDAGSWDPSNDQFGPSGGRLYTTCFLHLLPRSLLPTFGSVRHQA